MFSGSYSSPVLVIITRSRWREMYSRICSLPVNRLQLPASHLVIGQIQSHDKISLFSLANAVLPGVWPWGHVGILAFKVTMTGKCDIGQLFELICCEPLSIPLVCLFVCLYVCLCDRDFYLDYFFFSKYSSKHANAGIPTLSSCSFLGVAPTGKGTNCFKRHAARVFFKIYVISHLLCKENRLNLIPALRGAFLLLH